MAAIIQRNGTKEKWSNSVVHNGTVYLTEVADTLGAPFDVQTAEVLASIERQLAELGSGKHRLLHTTVYLTDFANLEDFNKAWIAWLPAGTAPARACVKVELVNPGYLVELTVIAAV
eukprot:TRINITY_DN11914_c0_g1_i1.p2 TRINITY_DN11914_c0_g1~~TRINITY_DN11914_c0_g1_i1.p2  ORF type:complete len:117 (+),score=39.26 TRINITY_DN11914_c0_g1_i1:96-446(+)